MVGYVRQRPLAIVNSAIIDATDLAAEFNKIEEAFGEADGHSHNGTAAGGSPILTVGPFQEVAVTISSMSPKTDATLDLGTNLLKFKDAYFSGSVVGNFNATSLTTGTVPAARLSGTYTINVTTLEGNNAAFFRDATNMNAGILPAARLSGTYTIDVATLQGSDKAFYTNAGNLNAGTLLDARIPSLDTSKITTGTFLDARIPSLDAGKTTTGVFADARIPSLAASKTTSGVFDEARIPLTYTGSFNFRGLSTEFSATNISTTPQTSPLEYGVVLTDDGQYRSQAPNTTCFDISRAGSGGTLMQFRQQQTGVGSISVTGATTAYNTSSDYRLKENIQSIQGATDIVEYLRPCFFNFKSHPEEFMDGFLAHEVAEVVPNAVLGSKDEVDQDGNPVYQSIDHSKLVPLLTKALQEALERITQLESRVSALEG